MDFFARLMGLGRRSSGDGEDISTEGADAADELSLTPGLDREIEGEAAAEEDAEEHEEPR